MSQNKHLSWSLTLGALLPKPVLQSLCILPHDVRRAVVRRVLPKYYWKIQSFRQGKYPPYDYSGYKRLSTIFVHIPKAAGTFIYKKILNSHVGHLTIFDYQMMFGSQFYDRAFKFTVVRNPWDRLVSAFFYLKGEGCSQEDKKWAEDNLSTYECFESFVLDLENRRFHESWIHFIPQYKFITDPLEKLELDYIGRTEDLKKSLEVICNQLNIPIPEAREKVNPSKRDNYIKYYTPRTSRIVEKIYARDIELFGYKFGS